ncbi:GlxA family transcriptional regulator [Mesobacterium pallidum]|uniref:GlxA family transcriptional regulator n=1 Tax=Mesobacterium pallidum TaxID=2872037 RepID=UPI001EE32146|nr:GlxA family transcriptional regulator [Mesobacterium pallidum]
METDHSPDRLTSVSGPRDQAPRGIATIALGADVEPVDFTFVGLGSASMLAFTSAVEPLRVLNQLAGRRIARWRLVTPGGAPLTFSCGLSMAAEDLPVDLPRHGRVIVCSGAEPEASLSDPVTAMVRRAWRHGHVVGGICTGAYTLAQAGLLRGHAFTLHWENTEAFELRYPGLRSTRQLFAIDRAIMTCAGGTAATDMMLAVINDRYGPVAARVVMEMCLHPAMRPPGEAQKASLAFAMGVRNERFLALVEDIEDSANWLDPIASICERHAMSRRQMERLFKKYTGHSPRSYARLRRLDHARMRLTATNLSIQEVASECGFESSRAFAISFKKRFGVTPTDYSLALREGGPA